MKIGEAVYDTEGKLGVPGSTGPIASLPWESHMSVKTPAWCFVEGEKPYEVKHLLAKLVDVVSKNGCLTLNIGPRPDGTLPALQEKVLLEIGEWMKVNGEGITGSKPWKIHGVGDIDHHGRIKDEAAVRFTRKEGKLYAYFVTWPKNGILTIPRLAEETVGHVGLLGHSGELETKRTEGNLLVELPAAQPCQHVWALEITL
jgi:alpha-L-fucosidase